MASDYSIYVPLPFAPGDIVKSDSLLCEAQYGVFSHEWKPPINKMFTSMEVSFCKDDELPKGQDALRLIREVRKGKMDFYDILHWYSRENMDGLIKTINRKIEQ